MRKVCRKVSVAVEGATEFQRLGSTAEPRNLQSKLREPEIELHLDALNRELVDRLQRGGETFVSNAVVDGHYVLRACIVIFHTTRTDVEAVPDIVARIGCEVEAELRLKNSQPE